MFFKILFLYFCRMTVIKADFEDENCVVDGAPGKCMILRDCPSAIKDIRLHINPKICRFNGTSVEPIVCCLDYPKLINTQLSSSPTNITDDEECPPLDEEYAPKPKEIKQGHKAWAKCVEYQEKAVFPCSKNGSVRLDYCPPHNATGRRELNLGGGGVDAEIGEFPHMALLGYGSSAEDAEWLCGGSLISERFILTAGHCTATSRLDKEKNWRSSVKVGFAAMGVLERTEPLEDWDIYKITRIVLHPRYKSPVKYDDIALLETDRDVQFSDIVFPACLHVGDELGKSRASATGWGALGYHWNELSDILQDVPLWKVSDENCSNHYFPHRQLLRGYDNETQMCYGDDGLPRDTCRGDSGGPLQIKSPDIYCMFVIIGITSFGNVKCASIGYPGIYTRVAYYVPWVESVVWP